MRRLRSRSTFALLGLAGALFAGGCTIILEPDRDAIVPGMDGGSDGGRDAAFDGSDGGDAGDAGFDGGLDGGCRPDPGGQLEVSCNDGLDNDCDTLVDCDDADCAADGFCCDISSGSAWADLTSDYMFWNAFGSASPTATTVDFGTGTGQLVHRTCAPVAFGMRLLTEFSREIAGSDTDYASIVLAPVDTPPAAMPLLADLTLRVTHTGVATLERAGTIIGSSTTPLAVGSHAARVDLQPSVDEAGRPVLLVSASVGGQTLADRETLMPLSDLIGSPAGCVPDGLFLAVEGRGSGVLVSDAVQATTLNCPNPTQFISDLAGPLGEDPILASGDWRLGGAGEPALHATTTSGRTERVDLLVDASEPERSDEILRFVDFSIGGAARIAGGWFQRSITGNPEILGPAPSSREPALSTGAEFSPGLVAYARQAGSAEVFEIALANLDLVLTAAPGASTTLLDSTGAAGCTSLRDPSLVTLAGRENLLLFFTCETTGRSPRIGVATLRDNTVTGYDVEEVLIDLFPASAVGNFGRQGVLSPEVIVTGEEGGTYALRIWFLARDAGGRVTVGFAFGEAEVGALPRVSLYPGNPILGPEDAVLGGTCPLGCTIDSLAVTPTEGDSPLWSPPLAPSYLFLVERSRFRADGVDHELVPIRQPRPAGG